MYICIYIYVHTGYQSGKNLRYVYVHMYICIYICMYVYAYRIMHLQ